MVELAAEEMDRLFNELTSNDKSKRALVYSSFPRHR